MKKILFSMLVCLLCTGVQAQKMAKISATATGYSGKIIDFEFYRQHSKQPAVPVQGQPADGVRSGVERA